MSERFLDDAAVYRGSEVARIDRVAIHEYGVDAFGLMSEAGRRAFKYITKRFPEHRSMCVLCGSGNNGGDGYVVATLALQHRWSVAVLAAKAPQTESCRQAFADYQAAGRTLLEGAPESCDDDTLIVDALLGTGINSAPRGKAAKLIEWANQQSAPIVAIDAPSGVNTDTGAVLGKSIRAKHTVTFIAHKIGLLTGPAANAVGDLQLATLSIPDAVFGSVAPSARCLETPQLNPRPPESHKGSFGHALLIAGSNGMLGAGILAGTAALRAGCGKLHLLNDNPQRDLASLSQPEIMTAGVNNAEDLMASCTACGIGPGLGLSETASKLLAIAIESEKPNVIDADALSLLSQNAPQSLPHSVLTPHPGEAARLLGCSTSDIQNDRLSAAQSIADRYSAVCVLKGHGTLIAAPDYTPRLCLLGNAGMATAGSGDVLTGIVLSLLAQGHSPFSAACIGVWLHSRAGDIAAEQGHPISLIASDIIEHLPEAFTPASM